ncbi:MAG TPA: hypothetical protein VGI79_19880 [Caulobacteraceae bacterium]|jgi:hypothetical protein
MTQIKSGRPRAPSHLALAAVALALSWSPADAASILFVGNSFTYGAHAPVWKYRSNSVTDLNGDGVGGVPALFKLFTQEIGLDYAVSLETVGGKDLRFHLENKAALIDRPWDHVILQSYSTLDADKPGDATGLIRDSAVLAKMFHDKNPQADVRLMATWSRADLTYPASAHWHGQPIEAMAQDVRAGYDRAAANSPLINSVIPVGQAWNRAFASGFADPNPYDGISAGQVDLWAYDNYHASTYGYYLEALVVFGAVTGRDPRSLGPGETAASELGVSPAQASAMQQIAQDELEARPKP